MSLTIVKFAFLSVSVCHAQTSTALEDLVGDERGPGFKEVSGGITWLDVSNFYGMNYSEIEAALAGSGFRLAKKSEVQRLADAVGRYSNEFGIPSSPSPFPGSKVATGFYNDTDSGIDSSKAGYASAFIRPSESAPGNEGFVLFDDGVNKSTTDVDIGAWVVQQIASSCSTNPTTIDFDCDGVADKVVWRRNSGTWYIKFSSSSELLVQQWGLPSDIPVIGDYDGDGLPDLAVWRPSTGVWYIKQSQNQFSAKNSIVLQFGLSGDRPLRNDFDGDGRLDVGVWRPSDGNFYYVRSTDAQIVVDQWGLSGDVPMTSPRPN